MRCAAAEAEREAELQGAEQGGAALRRELGAQSEERSRLHTLSAVQGVRLQQTEMLNRTLLQRCKTAESAVCTEPEPRARCAHSETPRGACGRPAG